MSSRWRRSLTILEPEVEEEHDIEVINIDSYSAEEDDDPTGPNYDLSQDHQSFINFYFCKCIGI